MSLDTAQNLLKLPVEIIYKILDHLDDLTILCSCLNICIRMNAIIYTYYRYQVKFELYIFKQTLKVRNDTDR